MEQFTIWILDTSGWRPTVQANLEMAQRIAKRYREIGIECMIEASAVSALRTDGSAGQAHSTEVER